MHSLSIHSTTQWHEFLNQKKILQSSCYVLQGICGQATKGTSPSIVSLKSLLTSDTLIAFQEYGSNKTLS